MKTFTWLLKYIFFPLLPFIAGAFTRYLHDNNFSYSSLNAYELSFSMAALCLLVLSNANRIRNDQLAQYFGIIYQSSFVIFLLLFALAVFIQSGVECSLLNFWQGLGEKLANAKEITLTSIPSLPENYERMLEIIRTVAVILSIIIIPFSIYFCHKYDLEDL